MNALEQQITALLAQHRSLTAALHENQAGLRQAALAIGMTPEEVDKAKLIPLLDGWLMGAGVMPAHRRQALENVRDAGPSAFGGRNAGLRREDRL